jgi:Cd2+/Zn2+-exporting ATPase
MDKTGTITQGKPELVAHELLTTTILGEQVLHWAADLAAHSDHPVAQAVAAGLARHACNGDLTSFEALPGRGIRAQAHGVALILGNHRLMEERGLCSPALEARLDLHERQGRTVTLLASNNEVLALFAVADAIKETSREAVAELRALGVRSIMLTGDNEATARSIAVGAGIDDARGNLLPDEKLSAIEEMQRQNHFVAMTGDGINDAPALARADLGFAMGDAGTDIAMEAADVVIMNDDLRRIPETIKLSRRAHAVLWQNIGLALGIKAVFLVLAVAGNASMWMAVFADMGASLLVVFNGLRLLRVSN